MKVKVLNITKKELVNLFCSIVNADSVFRFDYDSKVYAKIPKSKKRGSCFEDKLADMLLNGKEIIVYDVESVDNGGVTFFGNRCKHTTEKITIYRWYDLKEEEVDACAYHITLNTVLRGLSMPDAVQYFGDMVSEDMDYSSAYCVLQLIVFGKLIYC